MVFYKEFFYNGLFLYGTLFINLFFMLITDKNRRKLKLQ